MLGTRRSATARGEASVAARVNRGVMISWVSRFCEGGALAKSLPPTTGTGICHWLNRAIHRGGRVRVTPFRPWAVDFLWEGKRLVRINGQRLKEAGRTDPDNSASVNMGGVNPTIP